MITGRTRYRLGWRGKVVLQVQCWERQWTAGRWPGAAPWAERWRDATFRDVLDIAEGRVTPERPPVQRAPRPPRGDE